MNGDNGEKKLKETEILLSNIIYDDKFKIFILDDSPWLDKAREMANNPKEPTRTLMHLLLSVVIRNITKCGIIYRNELPRVP
ncbi:MAG: hypothetical protein ACP5R0_05730, partial [Thermoplasmata archaeon]